MMSVLLARLFRIVLMLVALHTLGVSPPASGQSESRVTAGLRHLYEFEEGSGNVVGDVSGAGKTLDLTILDPSAVTWTSNGLSLDTPTLLLSSAPAFDLNSAVRASGEITVEAWITPTQAAPDTQSKIITLSDPRRGTNLTLAQGRWQGPPADVYDVFLRSTGTDLEGRPPLTSPFGSALAATQHVLSTRSADGTHRLYVDGVEVANAVVPGGLSGWKLAFHLGIGDEPDRLNPWLGELHLVALYDRALTPAEVAQNHAAGSGGDVEPPPPSEELPAPEIGPQAAVMLDVGQTTQLAAAWPADTPSELVSAPFVWTSSNPAIATVDGNGLVTALTDDAYAVITVHADAPMAHRPGFGSVTIGAEVAAGLVALPEGVLVDVISSGEDELTVTVVDDAQTASLTVGDIVSFGDAGALDIATITDQGSELVLTGAYPRLEDAFIDLHIHVTPEDNERMQTIIQTALGTPASEVVGGTPPATKMDDDVAGCALKSLLETNVPVFPNFEVDIVDSRLLQLALTLETHGEVRINGISADLGLECEVKLPSLPFGGIPVPAIGLVLELEQAYKIGGVIELSTESVASVTTPSGGVSQSFSGGLEYHGEALELAAEAGPPVTNFDPGAAQFDSAPTQTISVSQALEFEIAPLRVTLSAFGIVELAEIDIAVLEASVGMDLTVPLGERDPGEPGYVNPDLAGFLRGDFVPSKIRTGDGLNALLRVFGASGLEAQTAAISVIDERLPWPRPLAPSYDPDLVFNQSVNAQFPDFSFVSIDTQDDWPSLLPQPVSRYEVWGRLEGSSEPFEPLWASATPNFRIEPGPEHEGKLETRAVAFYSIPPFMSLLPVVSATSTLDVREGGVLFFEDEEDLIRTLTIGEEVEVPSLLSNLGDIEVTYSMSLEDTTGWVTLDGGDGVLDALDPQNGRAHDFLFICNESFLGDNLTELILTKVPNDGEVYTYPVYMGCSLLDVDPNHLSFELGLRDGPKTKTVLVRNAGDTPLEVFPTILADPLYTNTYDITVSPASLTALPQGIDQVVSVTVDCHRVGQNEVTLDLAIALPPSTVFVHEVPVTIDCTDDGGSSWGDPHMVTFDGVKYDFQAAGEFVMVRDTASDFEIQTRQQGSSDVTRNTAAAMSVGGERVAFYVTPPAGGGAVMIEGAAVTVAGGAMRPLAGGGAISRDGNAYTVEWPDGETYVQVKLAGTYISLFVHPAESMAGTVAGLLGDADGDGANDFRLRDGTALSSPPSFAELYDCATTRCLAYDTSAGWALTGVGESLFDYNPGEGPETFAPAVGETYPEAEVDLADYDDALVAWASAQCTAAGIVDPQLLDACILDIVVTGEVAMGLEAATIDLPAGEPQPEVCDGSDNDADGDVDEGNVCGCSAVDSSGRTYLFCVTRVPWTDARTACLAAGSDLVRIEDAGENAWINAQVRAQAIVQDYWMGLTDDGVEGVWLWTDGGLLLWENWGGSEPNNAGPEGEDCGQHVAANATWNDLNCGWDNAFICE